MNEIEFCINGRKMAGLQWGDPEKPLLLALHGWLDNAASFIPLAQYLDDYYVVALDWPGHGGSYHKQDHYHFVDWVDDLYQIITQQAWQPVTIIAHSMGGMVASVFAAVFPELVKALVLIEGFGLITSSAEDTLPMFREGILSRAKTYNKSSNSSLALEKVIKARCLVTPLSEEHAELICRRNLIETQQGFVWRSDAKVRSKSILRMTNAQAKSIFSNFSVPCVIILGDSGYSQLKKMQATDIFKQSNCLTKVMPGSHHLHMEHPREIAIEITNFLTNQWPKKSNDKL